MDKNVEKRELNVPKACADCPYVRESAEHIGKHDIISDELISIAMDQSIMDSEIASLKELLEHLDIELPPDMPTDPGELAKMMRAMLGELHESNLAHIVEIEKLAVEHAHGCLGALALSGSPDGRRQYDVNVCTSPRNTNGQSSELAVVNRSIK